MKLAARQIVAAVVMLVLGALPAAADVVELTNGERLDGVVTETRGGGIVVRMRNRDLWIPQDRVRSITFADAPAQPAQRPSAPAAPPATATAPPTPAASAPGAAAPPASPGTPAAPAPGAAAPPASPGTPAAPGPSTPRPVPPEVVLALKALDQLQIATGKPLPPADYVTRIEQTRREVDRALGGLTDEDAVRRAMGAALHYHDVAAEAARIYDARDDLRSVRADALDECRPLSDFIARDAAQLKLDPASPGVVGLLLATEGAPVLRECAGEKIAEAESLARAPR